MPIRLECRHCSTQLEAADSAVGKALACPKCGSPLQVPAPEDGASQQAAEGPAGGGAIPDTPAQPAEDEQAEDDQTQADEPEQAAAFESAVDSGGSSFVWFFALILLVVGVGAYMFFSRDSEDEDPVDVGGWGRVSSVSVEKTNRLYKEALAKVSAGDKKGAIELYEKVIDQLEKLPPATARNCGLKSIRAQLEALKTGKTVGDQQPPEEPGRTEQPPDGATDPPQ